MKSDSASALFATVSEFVKNIISAIKNNERTKRMAVRIVSFTAIFTITATVLGLSNLTYALGVSVNGNSYGFVRDEQEATEAIGNLLARLVVAKGDVSAEPYVNCTPTVVPADAIISSGELADKIVEDSEDYINVVTVSVNGEVFARAESVSAAEQLIYAEVGDGILFNNIEIRESVMSPSSYAMIPDFSEVCHADVDVTVPFNVYDDTSSADIEYAYATLNAEGWPASAISGTVININTTLPVLTAVTVEDNETVQNVTAYETGTKAGKNVLTVRTYSVLGVEYMREEISAVFTEKYADKPVATEVINAGDSGFCWPVDTGYTQYISSFWGDDRGHKGYDIACKTGTPILAAYDGYVESVNTSGSGYGLHFVIKHNNGLKTLYAHCSKLYVSVGDKVTRGEVVALVGTSGNVTGSHLHFEVLSGNARLNPMKYIGKR